MVRSRGGGSELTLPEDYFKIIGPSTALESGIGWGDMTAVSTYIISIQHIAYKLTRCIMQSIIWPAYQTNSLAPEDALTIIDNLDLSSIIEEEYRPTNKTNIIPIWGTLDNTNINWYGPFTLSISTEYFGGESAYYSATLEAITPKLTVVTTKPDNYLQNVQLIEFQGAALYYDFIYPSIG